MEKTKFGVSVALVGAAVYFLASFHFLSAFILGLYILLKEENEWLKRSVMKMLIIVVSLNLIVAGADILDEIFRIADNLVGWIFVRGIDVPLGLDRIIISGTRIIQTLVLVLLGFRSLSMGTVKSKFFDKMLNKHM